MFSVSLRRIESYLKTIFNLQLSDVFATGLLNSEPIRRN